MRSEPREIVERLIAALGVETQAQLAARLEIRPQSIVSAITRGEIPVAWLYRVAYLTGRSVEWLRTGKGEGWREGVIAETPPRAYGGKGQSAVLRRILDSWEELDTEEQATVERCVQALRSGDREIRDHLVAQMKLIEEAAQWRRAKRGRRHE
jgi:hypothetical protein